MLVLVETTDVVFAVDSIPAILAISRSTFIVFASNVFAILGLRALYFLLVTAFRVARHKETEIHPDHNPVLRIVRRVVPSTNDYDGQKLFTRRTGRLLATPLFAVLVLVETTDVVFAVDSIPAILAVSRSTFIVFASNVFAILGLRALYFLLAGMKERFRCLNIGLGAILGFVGIKMMAVEFVHLPTWASLGVITIILTVTILASLRAERREPTSPQPVDDLSNGTGT